MNTTIAEHLTSLVQAAAAAAGHADSPIPLERVVPCGNPDHGDYQSNFAFRLGKSLRTNPRNVASELVASFPKDPAVASVDVAGPGFLNIKLADEWLAADCSARGADARLGVPEWGAGKTMVIDYSSPNVAKRTHVGHLRSTVIGSAIDRLHRFCAWNVVADNHLGDWGTPIGKLVVGWGLWLDQAAYDADPVGELQRIYQKFEEDKDDALMDQARAATARLQEGDGPERELWREIVRVSRAELDTVYERFGVKFDITHGESHYHDELQDLISELVEKGLAEESEGAIVVPFDGSIEPKLKEKAMLIRKSDGSALYATTDLATVRDRVNTFHANRIVYVVDVRQANHFRQVFTAAKKWGFTEPEYVHVGFGMLKVPGGGAMSSRKGDTVNLVDLLDEAAERAGVLVAEKNPEWTTEQVAPVAEAIGVSTVRYFDLSQNPTSNITFSWDSALALVGNTAPYLMYAYARCGSLLRKAEWERAPGVITLPTATERRLAFLVSRTPEVIEQAANSYRPNALCDHLYETAQQLARFWEECPVLKDVDDDTRDSRLSLVAATRHALGIGFGIVGLATIERM